ncbi:MAG: ABC transporter ATP-binding protein [Acidobacteriota bacterium]
MRKIIVVKNLTKRYENVVAVNDVSFEIEEGEIFGILGPNGAGKTTTIEIMEGLRKSDEGYVRIDGFDPYEGRKEFKELIGVQLQKTAIFPTIKVWEAIDFFGSLYQRRIDTERILEIFSLKDRRNSYIKNLSGGEHQRLSVALAFVNDPNFLFLDEPTTGMDPNVRRDMWEIIEESRRKGKTIILTTHYMEEAEKLCDRVAIIDRGKIIAIDRPKELIKKLDADKKIEFKLERRIDPYIFRMDERVKKIEEIEGEYTIYTKDPQSVLSHILTVSSSRDLQLQNLRVIDANLEDVFISLTGRKIE